MHLSKLLFLIVAISALPFTVCAQIRSLSLVKDASEGYQWKVPAKWNQLPPQPSELSTLAKLNSTRGRSASQLLLLRFEPKTGTTSGDGEASPNAPEEAKPGEQLDRAEIMRRFRESMRPRSFSQWYARSRRGRKLPSEPISTLKIGGGIEAKVFFMPEHGGKGAAQPAAMASVFQYDGREWAIYFTMARRDLVNLKNPKKKTRIWPRLFSVFKSFKPIKKKEPKPTSAGDADSERLAAVVQKAGHKLPDDWHVLASPKERYVIVHHIPRKKTRQLAFVRNIQRYLEFMRERYEELFPPRKPITEISVVRVCASREEYHQYGGPGGSAGYWNPGDRELVIYDASKSGGAKNTYSTLFHEAFHQYIYYAVGEISPHSWFNEGYGDYFAGANPKRRFKIGPFQWRTSTVRTAVATGKAHHLKDLMTFTQMQYYTRNPGMCYAQGWALVYFLNSRKGLAHTEWKTILPNYFETLVKTKSKKKALEAAIGGLDIEALNTDYQAFIRAGFK